MSNRSNLTRPADPTVSPLGLLSPLLIQQSPVVRMESELIIVPFSVQFVAVRTSNYYNTYNLYDIKLYDARLHV